MNNDMNINIHIDINIDKYWPILTNIDKYYPNIDKYWQKYKNTHFIKKACLKQKKKAPAAAWKPAKLKGWGYQSI